MRHGSLHCFLAKINKYADFWTCAESTPFKVSIHMQFSPAVPELRTAGLQSLEHSIRSIDLQFIVRFK